MLARQTQPVSDAAPPIVAQIAAFEFGGRPTRVETRDETRFFFNEFWTARQRQANRLHEISYRACFKPQLPEFFISRLTRPGDTVYDPFMGRGTTPVQAALMGRRAIGVDVNPLSAMLARPRLAPPPIEAVEARLGEIDWRHDGPLRGDLAVFFHADTLTQIHALREWFVAREKSGAFDAIDDWIRMVALNRLTGHSPGFLSVYTMPPNQAVSIEAQRKINDKRQQIPTPRDARAIILKKSRALLSGAARAFAPDGLDHRLLTASADVTPQIADASVDLVVTSPPFLDIVQYAADNWLRCWFAGVDPQAASIAMHRGAGEWTRFIHVVLRELGRVTRIGGHVAFEVGEVRKGAVELDALVMAAMAGLPFELLCVLVNTQAFTKTANCWGVTNNAMGTNTNRIVLARRV